jgi:uncharacterized protein YueI
VGGELQSWKKLMEDKGKQEENQFKLKVQLQRQKLQFKKEQFYLKETKGYRGKVTIVGRGRCEGDTKSC